MAPEVKMISLVVAPISLAMRSRAVFHGLFRRPSEGVIAAGRVAELLREVGQHLFQHPRIHRGGGVVVHVDGQLDALGVGLWVSRRAWGIFTSVLIDCLSCFAEICWMKFFFDGSADGHQIGRLRSVTSGFFRLFAHVRNLDPLQYRLDALVHLAQRFANVAAVALVAFAAHRDAGGDEQRTVDRLNDLEGRNRVRRARQRIAAVGAVLRLQQSSLGQTLQDLGQGLWRDAVGVSDVLRAARGPLECSARCFIAISA